MSWPTPQDYNEAIQNPALCFSDLELIAGTVALTPLGLPKPYSGGFATVYKVECQGRTWAVRCFQRELIDQQRRYEVIDQTLRAASLTAMVGFQFLPKGIRIAGHWYPVLKMEWVTGELLNDYIETHLHNSEKLMVLARQWVELLSALHGAGIAHGDLQHGNVLVANGALKLIDYDGMWVPGLAGYVSREDGHRNYQHPKRDGKEFGPYLDNFSAWVIWVSLATFAVDPSLWEKLKCGDEHLLFQREDFERPDKSRVFAALDRSDKPQLPGLSARLRGLLYLPLNQIPSLDGITVPQEQPRNRKRAGVPEWLSDHIPEERLAPLLVEPIAVATPTVGGANWIFEHLLDQKPLLPALPALSLVVDRFVLVLLMATTATVALMAASRTVSPLFAVATSAVGIFVVLAILLLRYSLCGIVAEKRHAMEKLSEMMEAVARLETTILALYAEREQIVEPLMEIDRRYRSIPQRSASAARDLQHELDETLATLDARRDLLGSKESNELIQTDEKMQLKRAELLHRQTKLDSAEASERDALVSQARDAYVRQALTTTLISAQRLSGIGPKMKGTLSAYGFRTAADVTWHVRGVPGIGDAKASTLVGWRNAVENAARKNFRGQLSSYDEQCMQSKYSGARQAISNELQELSRAHHVQRRSIHENYGRYRQQIVMEENAARAAHPKRLEKLRETYQSEKERLTREFEAAKASFMARRRTVDERLAELGQSVFQRRVEQHGLQRQAARYRRISFPRYVAQIFGLLRSA